MTELSGDGQVTTGFNCWQQLFHSLHFQVTAASSEEIPNHRLHYCTSPRLLTDAREVGPHQDQDPCKDLGCSSECENAGRVVVVVVDGRREEGHPGLTDNAAGEELLLGCRVAAAHHHHSCWYYSTRIARAGTAADAASSDYCISLGLAAEGVARSARMGDAAMEVADCCCRKGLHSSTATIEAIGCSFG